MRPLPPPPRIACGRRSGSAGGRLAAWDCAGCRAAAATGMPLLNSLSIVAVCAMFGAGIVVGLIMDACNVLEITPLAGRL